MGKDKGIDMQMGLDHLRHIFKAKGRHGTHSPFVYAFVEKVLRDKQALSGYGKNIAAAHPELNHLLKTIAFLRTENLVFFHPHLLSLKPIVTSVFPQQVLSISRERTATHPNTLVLIDASRLRQEEPDELKHLKSEHPFGLYFLYPHVRGSMLNKKEKFRDWINYAVSMDFWDGLLLCQHPDFKQKQHFLLR